MRGGGWLRAWAVRLVEAKRKVCSDDTAGSKPKSSRDQRTREEGRHTSAARRKRRGQRRARRRAREGHGEGYETKPQPHKRTGDRTWRGDRRGHWSTVCVGGGESCDNRGGEEECVCLRGPERYAAWILRQHSLPAPSFSCVWKSNNRFRNGVRNSPDRARRLLIPKPMTPTSRA